MNVSTMAKVLFLSPCSIIWYQATASAVVGKVTVGLARVIYSSDQTTDGLEDFKMEMSSSRIHILRFFLIFQTNVFFTLFSERDLTFTLRSLYAIAVPSVVCLSVTFVRPTQPVEIFGNFSSPFGTLAIH